MTLIGRYAHRLSLKKVLLAWLDLLRPSRWRSFWGAFPGWLLIVHGIVMGSTLVPQLVVSSWLFLPSVVCGIVVSFFVVVGLFVLRLPAFAPKFFEGISPHVLLRHPPDKLSREQVQRLLEHLPRDFREVFPEWFQKYPEEGHALLEEQQLPPKGLDRSVIQVLLTSEDPDLRACGVRMSSHLSR